MPVRNQNIIRRNLIGIDVFCQLIAGNEWVKQYSPIGKLRCKAGVSVISDLHIPSPVRVSNVQQDSRDVVPISMACRTGSIAKGRSFEYVIKRSKRVKRKPEQLGRRSR